MRTAELQLSIDLDWARFNVPHFRSFRRRWGGCGISQDCSHSQSPQCVRCWVVCARPLLITVVCMCIIWKVLCPYVLDARLGLWVSLEHAFTCVSTTNQAEDAQALLTSWLVCGSTRGLQPGGHVHICYPYSRHPLEARVPLNLSVMTCHSLERTQADPLCLFENLIS